MSTSLDESDIQDLVDQVTDYLETLPENEKIINSAFNGVNEFLYHPTPPPRTVIEKNLPLWQYRIENQHVYHLHKLILDRQTSHVYPLLKDLVKVFFQKPQEDQPTLREQLLPPEMQPIAPQMTTNTYNMDSNWMDRLRNPFKQKPRNVEELLDPSRITVDIVEKAKNSPNQYFVFARFHETNMVRQRKFMGYGMDKVLDIERWFFNSRVTVELNQLIESSKALLRTEEVERVALVLAKYYEQKEKHRNDFNMNPPQQR